MAHSDESALPPDHPEVRRASLLLSTLLLTPDKGLESYRRSRCADPALELRWQARLSVDAGLRKQFDAHRASIGAWIHRERG